MPDQNAALQAIVDRESIRDCLARLARGEDRRDADLIRSAYWPDASIDYGIFEGDFDAYLAWVVPGADAIANTLHVLGQSHIKLDGQRAKAETHVISYHRVDISDGARDICIGGRYLDEFGGRDGAWRIAARTMLYDWFQDWGASIDWSQGVMGLPFSAPHFAGRANADFSKSFFAERSPATQ